MRLPNMPMKQPSRKHTTGAGVATTAIAARKIATIVRGFIDMKYYTDEQLKAALAKIKGIEI